MKKHDHEADNPEPPQRFLRLTEPERARPELRPFSLSHGFPQETFLPGTATRGGFRPHHDDGRSDRFPYEKLAAVRLEHQPLAENAQVPRSNRIPKPDAVLAGVLQQRADFLRN